MGVRQIRASYIQTAPLSDAVEPKFSPRSCRVCSNLAPRNKMLPTVLRDSQFFHQVYAVVTRWCYFSSASTLCKLFPIVIESRQAKHLAVQRLRLFKFSSASKDISENEGKNPPRSTILHVALRSGQYSRRVNAVATRRRYFSPRRRRVDFAASLRGAVKLKSPYFKLYFLRFWKTSTSFLHPF